MGLDHPVAWCKDWQGGRSFYTALGNTVGSFADAAFRSLLGGAIGPGRPESRTRCYTDCGATVLANYQQTKVSAPPNLSEPIGFDVLPDGRVIQTDRRGGVRLHDPASNTTTVLAEIPVYTASEDGMYGPAIDTDFADNRWVYLFYSPPTVEDVRLSTGEIVTQTTPAVNAPNTGESPAVWDPWVGYFQLSRFKFVDATGSTPAHLDLASEQEILRVPGEPRRLLPRRRRHRLRRRRQPLARHRRRHAGRRWRLRRLRTVQRPAHRDRPLQRAARRRPALGAEHERPARQDPPDHRQAG